MQDSNLNYKPKRYYQKAKLIKYKRKAKPLKPNPSHRPYKYDEPMKKYNTTWTPKAAEFIRNHKDFVEKLCRVPQYLQENVIKIVSDAYNEIDSKNFIEDETSETDG